MTDKTKSVEELATEVKGAFQSGLDAVKGIAEEALGKANKGEQLTASMKERTDDALNKLNDLKTTLDALMQKSARGHSDAGDEQKTIGEMFVSGDGFSHLANSSGPAKHTLQTKATLTTASGTSDGNLGASIQRNTLSGIQMTPLRRLTIRALLGAGRTDSPTVEYFQEASSNNNAATVAEGAVKPESDFRTLAKTTNTRVIANTMTVTRQTLSDVAQIQSIINTKLLQNLAHTEEKQFLFGDGTGQNLHGIVPQATSFNAPITLSDETSLDRIRLMMLQSTLSEHYPNAIVMNPIDWAFIETLKDTTGRYLIGNPQGGISPTLWGLPVVATTAMTVDKVLTGAFDTAAQIFDQWSASVVSGWVNDDFARNKVTLLAEQRLALAVYRPDAFIYGDFGRVA